MTKDWLELCLSNPEIHVVKTEAGNWFLSAMDTESLGQLIRDAGKKGLPPTETLARMAPEMEEGTVVFLPSPELPDPRVLAFKSVICSREIYWVSPSAGRFVLADRLADLLPELPRANRVLSGRRAVHFLLGCNIRGDWTLVEDIHRAGHGELLLFTPGEREPGKRRIQRFSWDSVIEDENESLKVLEKALDRVSGFIGPAGNKAMMFSGGIDSTLLWACLSPRIPALTGFVDSDPAEAETARTVASRHGIEHKVLPVREAGFLEEFRETLKDVGQPFVISNFQIFYYRQAFQSGFSHLVSGELADSLWGITHTARIFEEGENPKYSVSMGNSPLAPGGYGIRVHLLLPDDLGLLERAYGEKTVLDYLGENLSYALDCLDPAVPLDRDYKKGHADLGSLAFILNGSWRSNYRQAGYVNGVGFSFPFETLSMVRAALSITLPGRILSKDGKLKPLIHRMLTKKLPGSGLPEKSGSGLPRTRYCQEGPFKGFFLDHPVPGYWPDEWADLLKNPTRESSSLVLKCASLQMWEKEVLGNSRIDQMGSEFP
jgi:asparagine synthetase B (glutamine-hydrolysing)